MRAEIGISDGATILEAMESMTPDQLARANSVIERHEAEAARRATLNPGAAELLHDLTERRFPIALLTRNCRASVKVFCEMFDVRFDAVHTREDGVTKPSPEPVLHLCREMNVAPQRTLMVGDYLYDIISGREAGSHTCLIVHGERPEWAEKADLVIEALDEIPTRVELVDRD
jgi:HAD superfamily hydrolase (TIGR01509 family)